MANYVYGMISRVQEGGPAWDGGVRLGDELISINSHPVRDVLDYQYLCLEEDLELVVKRDGEILTFSVDRDEDEDLGIDFGEDLFDGVHTCGNNCIFCFLQQMPLGLRPSLYVKDDDYRLSLAHGNYITLTNLSEEEIARICSQRMSPIYVSVQATDPELRACMLRNKSAGRIMKQLRRLADARITMQTQIVLCPGVNDGVQLERSVRDLSELHPWVESIGVVPVGLTKFRDKLFALNPFDGESARAVVESCIAWQREFRRKLGSRKVYPSDEFYLLAGIDFPSAGSYEGFPQLENGIGLSRLFLDEVRRLRKSIGRKRLRSGRYVLVTGVLAEPLVREFAEILAGVEGVNARVCVVKNDFLGDNVTVAGLLSGADIARSLAYVTEDEEVLIPEVVLNEDRFLDDMTLAEMQGMVRGRITVVPWSPRETVRLLSADAQ